MTVKRTKIERLADEELMQLIGEKNAEAFEVYYDRHGKAAYSLAYRIVGNAGAAEDVAQEAFISVWRSGGRYDASRGSVRSWTLGVVRNRAIDLLRTKSGNVPKLDQDDEAVLEQRTSGELTETAALQRETQREVCVALEGLPDEQSKVIELAYFGGFSQSEISEMLSIPLGTVKGRMRLGLEKVRGGLEGAFS